MTRINAGISPKVLSDQHLLAEHREIKRLPNAFSKNLKPIGIPAEFTFGTGHVKFFLDKGKYTLERYKLLYAECIERGFEVTDYSKNWEIYKQHPDYDKDYEAGKKDIQLLISRIRERLVESKRKPRFHKKKISVVEMIEKIKGQE